MVAPSFQAYKVITEEPFIKNGKLYITVQNPSTMNKRDVRWYSDKEYAKLYGVKTSSEDGFAGLKQARGFSNGDVIILYGYKATDEDYLRRSVARRTTDFDWHIVSTDSIPTDLPPHIRPIPITWEEASEPDGRHMKPAKAIATAIRKKILATA